MKNIILPICLFAVFSQLNAQTTPAITAWLINTTNLKGQHYVQGNPTPIQDNVLANVQSVQYSNDWVYVDATGIPAYITGPFLDGNPSIATAQTGYFKLPLHPVQNTGTSTPTNGGNIGLFINGVALFDYRDGVAWNPGTSALCGMVSGTKVQTINEPVTSYNPATAVFDLGAEKIKITLFPNPSSDFIAVQMAGLLKEKLTVSLFDINGKQMQQTTLQPGSTIGYLDTRLLYAGPYVVVFSTEGRVVRSAQVVIQK